MRHEGWAVIIALLIALFPVHPAFAAQDCSLKQYASMHVGYTASGLPEVQVILNGQKVWMLVNTESALSVIDADTASAMHMKAQSLPAGMVRFGKQALDTYSSVAVTLDHLT